MIECVFTLDYEIYGDGTGTLKELVYDPAERLRTIFAASNVRFVAFVEVAELEKIEACGTDPSIDLVKRQIRNFHREGFEIGLHLHPQWSNARHEGGRWVLDYNEYSLCTAPRARVAETVARSLRYLRHAVDHASFTPLSFRAGSWLFQPTQPLAGVLFGNGIRIDSSVFKGGLLHNYSLDYRPALKNGYYWAFSSDVNEADPKGEMLELPIYTELVPSWKMATSKRVVARNSFGIAGPDTDKLSRIRDFMRFRYPLKLDFCRMSLGELTSMMTGVIAEDRASPEVYRPVVAIGHTKDFTDPHAIESSLSFLRASGIRVVTFDAVYSRLSSSDKQALYAV
ncbi:MAG: hypothetical protein ACRD3D_16935 [Terriglobia bacterium]